MAFNMRIRSEGTDVTGRRIGNAQRKAHQLWPGPIGEVIASHFATMEDLRSVLGPSSLSERLLTAVEALPEPATQVNTMRVTDWRVSEREETT